MPLGEELENSWNYPLYIPEWNYFKTAKKKKRILKR